MGLLPTPDPLSPAAQGPTPDQGQLVGGALAAEPVAVATKGLPRPTDVRPADEWLHDVWGGGDLPDVPVASCPNEDAQATARAAPGRPGEEPIGQLRLAESRLVCMLASGRASSGGKASRARGVLRQPPLADLAGLMPPADLTPPAGLTPPAELDQLAKLVSYRRLTRDQRQVASAEEPSSGSMPGLILPTSYDGDLSARLVDSGGASDTVASDSRPGYHAWTLPGLAPLTRFRAAVGEWIAQRLGPVVGQPDRQPADQPAPPAGEPRQP